jgi:hypothetical protein
MSAEVDSSEHGTGFWVALVIGGAVMAIAVRGAIDSLTLASFGSWGKWLIGLDLLNNFLILPLVALVTVVISRLPLGRCRAPVQAGLFASAIVLAVVGPCLAGLSASDNPTIQPLDYMAATLTVLAVVWAGMGLWAARRLRPVPASRSSVSR